MVITNTITSLEHHAKKSILIFHETVETLRNQINKSNDSLSNVIKNLSYLIDEVPEKYIRAQTHELSIKNKTTFTSTNYNEIETLVFIFILPIMEYLIETYTLLDNELAKFQENNDKMLNPKKNPESLLGLISLRDYSDLAIFIDFSIILCLYPLNIFSSSPKEYLYHHLSSKTLRRRLPRHINWLTTSSQSDNCFNHQVSLKFLQILEKFLSLDRFRPMFLPKYVTIYYASARFLEHNTSCSFFDSFEINTSFIESIPVPLLANSCQTLLRHCRLPFMKKHISNELNSLLERDMKQVFLVFLPFSSSSSVIAANNDWTIVSGACLRMAHVLKLSMKQNPKIIKSFMQFIAEIERKNDLVIVLLYIYLLNLYLPKQARFVMSNFIPTFFQNKTLVPNQVWQLVLFSQNVLVVIPKQQTKSWSSIQFYTIELGLMKRLIRIGAAFGIFLNDQKEKVCQVTLDALTTFDVKTTVKLVHEALIPWKEFDNSFQFKLQDSVVLCAAMIDSGTEQDITTKAVRERSDFLMEILSKMQEKQQFIAALFHFYLSKYLLTLTSNNSSPLDNNHSWESFVTCTILPNLCERFSVQVLMQGNGVLSLIKSIFETTSSGKIQDETQMKSLLSTTSLCLSLLNALLEIGNKKRSEEDENILQSFIPHLTEFANSSFLKDFTSSFEIADMSAHALALICSRKGFEEREEQETSTNLSVLNQARNDLASTMPPIRASGIVKLLHRAKIMTAEYDDEGKQNLDSPLITIISSTNDNENIDQLEPKNDILEMFQIVLGALSDTESYVYLAAIQCISCITDVKPAMFLPLICEGLIEGSIERIKMKLSRDVRVKLSEALLFVIRRRNEALSFHSKPLITNLIQGSSIPSHSQAKSRNTWLMTQKDTHLYFQNSIDFNEEDARAEKQLRLNTGGPLYEHETSDVIRSCCLSCLSEVCMLLPIDLLKHYVVLIIRLCVDALNLDSSRTVSRGASYLAKTIYERIFSEDGLKLAIAMGEEEETLYHTLDNVISRGDVVQEQRCLLYDPATVARCREALDFRQQACDMGLFALTKVYMQRKNEETKNPKIQLVRNLMGS